MYCLELYNEEMTKENPPTLISSSPWKGAAWIEKFRSRHGISAQVINIEHDFPEPASVCAIFVGTRKFNNFAMGQTSMNALQEKGIKTARLAIMDVNGMKEGGIGVQPELVTTCRGQMSAIAKITELSRSLLERSDDGVGRMIYMNILGYGQYADEKLRGMGVLIESSRLSISGSLLRVMAEPENWPKIEEDTKKYSIDPNARKLLNQYSIGGMDASLWGPILPFMEVKDGWVKWEDSRGRVWVADELGAPPEMEENMTTHLRGFPSRFIDYLARLPD